MKLSFLFENPAESTRIRKPNAGSCGQWLLERKQMKHRILAMFTSLDGLY